MSSVARRRKVARRLTKVGTVLLVSLSLFYFLPDVLAALHLYPEPKPRYDYHLVFPRDGAFSGNDDAPGEVMYVVERRDKSIPGMVDLTYFSKNNTVVIVETNLRNLSVSAKAVYHDEAWKMLMFDWRDDATLYKTYFVDKKVLYVDLKIDGPMNALTFIDVPKPTKILLDGADYSSSTVWTGGSASGSITAPVPANKVRHLAEIWFVEHRTVAPTAIATSDKTVVKLGEPIQFDGSASHDNDGNLSIKQHYWDFGDGEYAVGPKPVHAYNVTFPVAYRVDLVVEDWDRMVDRTSLYVNVNRGDSWPPVADAGPDVVGSEDESQVLNGSLSHDNTGIVSYEWTTGDGGNESGAVVAHAYARSGRYTATLVVKDAAGNIAIDSAAVEVVNRPPVAVAGPDISGAVNQSLIFDGSRSSDTPSDQPGLVHVWDFGDGTGGGGKVRKHAYSRAGDYNVTLTVIDDDGAQSTDQLAVQVEDRPNLPPVIRPIKDVFVRFGSPWSLNLGPYVSDDNISSLALSTDSVYAQPFPTNETRLALRLHYSDPLVTKEAVRVTVDDGQFNTSATFNVTVLEDDWPPDPVGSIAAQTVPEDETLRDAFNVKDYFADRDVNDTLTFAAIAPPTVSLRIETDGSVTIRGSKDWSGQATASIRAEDPRGAWVDQTFIITVTPVNDAPFVASQPVDFSVRLGEEWTIDLDTVFDDVDDQALVYTASDPAVKVDPATGIASWKPSRADESIEVYFTASDGRLTNQTLKIRVVAVQAGLDPVVVGIGALLAVLATMIVGLLYRRHRWKYEVHEAFVVTEAGLLAAHVSAAGSKLIHQELVAAMLSAIRKFVQESFGKDREGERGLGRLDYEGFVISVEQGEGFFVAVVMSGADSPPLRRCMRAAIAAVSARWGKELKDWDGDEERLAGMDEVLRDAFDLPSLAHGTPSEPESESDDADEGEDKEKKEDDAGGSEDGGDPEEEKQDDAKDEGSPNDDAPIEKEKSES